MGFGDFLGAAGGIIGGAVGFVATGFNPAGAAAGFAIGGAIGGAASGAEAAKEQKKMANSQKKQAQLQAWQQAMDNLRQFQLAQATSGVAWQASGASLESSGAMGVQGSVGAQAATNLNALALGGSFSREYYGATRELANINKWAEINKAVTTIGTTAMSIVPQTGSLTPWTETGSPTANVYGHSNVGNKPAYGNLPQTAPIIKPREGG